MNRVTPENITELGPNEVFVFGSNVAGRHGGGAAHVAWERFGAATGIGEGLVGQSYAFPTIGNDLEMRPVHESMMWESAYRLKRTAQSLPAITFYLTKVGCGIAGFDEDYMKQFFRDMPDNVIKPEGW